MISTLPYQLTENLFVLGHNLFLTYLVKGNPCTLIDLGVSGTVPLIKRQLEKIGVEPGDIGNLVVLHAHWDHACGLPYFKQLFPQAKVLGSAKARDVLGKAKIVNQFRQHDELYCSQLLEKEVLRELPAFIQYETMPVDQVVTDGETISLGGIEARFLATPGHSPCSFSVYLPSEKAAIISDAVGGYSPQRDEFLPIFYQSVKLTLDSLEKLKSLDTGILGSGHDMDMVCIGKENTIHYYKRVKDEIEKLVTEIRQMSASGASEEQLVDRLFQASYRGFLAEIYPPDFIKSVSPFLLKGIHAG